MSGLVTARARVGVRVSATLLNSSSSGAGSVSACAPPVTEMMISGVGSFHTWRLALVL